MRETKRKILKVYGIDNTKFLSPQELAVLVSKLDQLRETCVRDTLIIELALATGARESELLGIKKKDLIHAERSVFIKGLKGSNSREIPLREDLFERLSAFARERSGKLFLITDRRLRQIWTSFRTTNKKFHSLRHTFAIELFRKHRDLRLVQVALGHRNIANTMVYAQYIYEKEELRRLITC